MTIMKSILDRVFMTACLSFPAVIIVVWGAAVSPAEKDESVVDLKKVRPESPVNVTINLYLKYLEDLKEIKSQSTVLYYIEFYYHDKGLAEAIFRNPLYGQQNKTCVFVPKTDVWTFTQDFYFVINYVGTSSEEFQNIVVCKDGLITDTKRSRVTVTLSSFDITEFPFDSQTIQTYFGHGSAGTEYFRLKTNGSVGVKYSSTAVFTVTNVSCDIQTDLYEGSLMYSEYQTVKCNIRVVRQPWHIVLTFCIPCISVSVLLVLGIFGSSQPTEKTPKANIFQLGLMTLMALSVLILAMSEYTLPSAKLSKLQKFFLSLITIDVISTFCGYFWLRIHQEFIPFLLESDWVIEGLLSSAERKSSKSPLVHPVIQINDSGNHGVGGEENNHPAQGQQGGNAKNIFVKSKAGLADNNVKSSRLFPEKGIERRRERVILIARVLQCLTFFGLLVSIAASLLFFIETAL